MQPSFDAAWYHDWLFEAALPLWARAGVDPATGGFHEALAPDGTPTPSPRRARVQARQVYVFAEAGRLGWGGDWRALVERGTERYVRDFRRPDGLFRAVTAPDGTALDDTALLYDQAFALFGLCHAWRALGRPEHLRRLALDVLDAVEGERSHPRFGFEEGRPRVLPLLANPHMHLLEAALTWMEADDDPRWLGLGATVARAAGEAFIEPGSGAVREYYDGDWAPAAGERGRLFEPGHQYEWAWLLDRWARARGEDWDGRLAPMLALAEARGIDPRRGSLVAEVLVDGGVRDPVSRLWPHTERIKALAALGPRLLPDTWRDGLDRTAAVLASYLDVPRRGLWRDKLGADGAFVDEPSPASSFYHILGAITALRDLDAPPAG